MDNTCVCCGAVIPEGKMICYLCEKYEMREFNGQTVETKASTS